VKGKGLDCKTEQSSWQGSGLAKGSSDLPFFHLNFLLVVLTKPFLPMVVSSLSSTG
jgi:hypothetical protein